MVALGNAVTSEAAAQRSADKALGERRCSDHPQTLAELRERQSPAVAPNSASLGLAETQPGAVEGAHRQPAVSGGAAGAAPVGMKHPDHGPCARVAKGGSVKKVRDYNEIPLLEIIFLV